MKSLTGAIFLSVACSGTAYAQSSVTLYGSLDVGVGYNNNVGGSKQWEATSGNSEPDKWGMLGIEDLGGGLRAGFQLENGFLAATGAVTKAGSIFNRKSIIWLSSDSYGTVTLGHSAPLSGQWINPLSAAVLGDIYEAYHPGNIDELSSSGNSLEDNVVRYVTPSYRGLQAGAEIALGNTTNFGVGRSSGYGIRYANGPIRAAVTYGIEANRPTAIGSSIGFSSFQGVAGTAQYVADKLTNLDVAATYQLGSFMLHAMYTNVKLEHGGYSDIFRTYEGGTTYQFGAAQLFDLSAYTSTLAGRRWTQVSLIDQYSLSKATSVYAAVAFQQGSGGAQAVIYSNLPSSSSTQLAFRTGIHHSF